MRKLNQTFGNVAYGAFSDSNNYATETNNFGETAFGILNKSTIDPDNFTSRDVVKSSKATLFSIGNGTEEERKNVIEIKGNGDVYINGVAGYTGTDTDQAGNIAEEFQGVHDSLDSIHMQKDDDSDLVYTLIVDGEERGTINIPKDQFLEDVNYDDDTKELVFIFVTSDENNKEVRINIGNLVDIYSAGNGLSLTEGQFAIKLDPSTESYITVGADGLKVSGLDAKFDTLTQKDTEQDERIQTAETDIDALQSDLSALKGDGEGSIGNQIQTAVDALKGGVSESYDTLKKIEDNIVSTNGKFDEYQTSNDAEIAALKSKDTELSNKIDSIHVPSKVSELENDSKYQTEDQVNSRIQTVVGAAPEALDTLKEIGDALGNDPDFAATMTNKLTEIDGKIGSNTYTGANYISKETNLTDAVIQLDEEIKATNDNLALEHANAEATYSKLDTTPFAGANNYNEEYPTLTDWLYAHRSYIGTFKGSASAEDWTNVISSRHRNGNDDGNDYGMYIANMLTGVGPLRWNQQINGVWQGEKVILDSSNYTNYVPTLDEITTQVTAKLVDGAPETLDTLNELAAALGDDPNFATTVTNQIAQKADKTTATTSADGLMSAADKTKLDSIETSNFATKEELGGYLPLTGGTVTGEGIKIAATNDEPFSVQYNTTSHIRTFRNNGNDLIAPYAIEFVGGGYYYYTGFFYDGLNDNYGVLFNNQGRGLFTSESKSVVIHPDNSEGCIRIYDKMDRQDDSVVAKPDVSLSSSGLNISYRGQQGIYNTILTTTYTKDGVTIPKKTSSDLLNAAGGTTTLKTINGESLLGSGDIALDAEHITVKDTLGYFSGNNVESALQEIAQPLDTHLQNNTPGMKHIPSGGAANQILAWGANGTAKWENLSNIEVSTEDMLAYGVEWDVTVSDPQLTRIGNTSLHKSLPIQSGMYGCVCQGATIRYRLDDNDWRYKREPDFTQVNLTVQDSVIKITADAFSNLRYDKQWIKINDIEIQIASIDTDSATATLINNEYTGTLHDGNFNCELGSVRNGYDGTVKVYVPGFYIKSVSEGNIRRVWLSTSQVDSTYHYQQPVLVDAYRCTVLNTVPENMGYLSTLPANTAVSIANTNTYCRGGSNNSNYDQYLENDPRRTQLGKPRTSLSRATMRGYASNANAHLLTYEEYKNIFYWLYVVEYANFNSQATFSSSLDDNGYATGGLGNGVTTMNGNVWSGYNGYRPLTPCGYLDSLGNGSGIEPQVLEAFDMSVNPTKNFGSWTAQTYRDGNNNPYKATMSKGNPTLTITNVARTGQILYCNSQVAAGVATYTVSGLQEGQQISFSCSGQTTQTVTADGPVTMDWGTNGSQTRNINANFTGSCNITITCDTVQSPITAEYPSQSITVNRWRGFDNPFGDIWTNLDGVIIDADADSHSNSMDYVYTCSDPAKFADELTSDYVKIAESTHSEGNVRAFDLGDTANIIASQVGGGSTTFMCDYHWTGNADTTLRTLLVGGRADTGALAGLGSLLSHRSVSFARAIAGFRSVSIAQ